MKTEKDGATLARAWGTPLSYLLTKPNLKVALERWSCLQS